MTTGRLTNPNELLALYNTKTRRYLFSDTRTFGVSLGWSSTNSGVHQWQVKQVSGSRFALYNTVQRDYLVYGGQPLGINLRWREQLKPPSPSPGGVKTLTVHLNRQQVIQGNVPYLARFGQGIRGNIQSIQNTGFANATIRFVKPGFGTQDCGNPNATVDVAPRATLTADQMKAAFGSAQPRLPGTEVAFLACVAAPPSPNLLSFVEVSVSYREDAG